MASTVRTRRAVKRINATSENGEAVVIVQYQTFVTVRMVSGSSSTVEGAIDFELDDGTPVNSLADGLYMNVLTDEILTPDA